MRPRAGDRSTDRRAHAQRRDLPETAVRARLSHALVRSFQQAAEAAFRPPAHRQSPNGAVFLRDGRAVSCTMPKRSGRWRPCNGQAPCVSAKRSKVCTAMACACSWRLAQSSNLTGFTDDVLRSKPHAAIPSNVHHRSGIVQLHHALGQLVAHGLNPNLAHLYARRSPRPVTEKTKPKRLLALGTGIQPARLPADFKLPKAEIKTPAPSPQPPAPALAAPQPRDQRAAVLQEHLATMEQLVATAAAGHGRVSRRATGQAAGRAAIGASVFPRCRREYARRARHCVASFFSRA